MNPAGRTVLLAAVGVALALLVAVSAPTLWPVWMMYWFGLLAALVLDAIAVARAPALQVHSQPPKLIYIGTAAAWKLRFDAESARTLEMLADLDEDFEPQPTATLELVPGTNETTIELRPRRRGTLRLEQLWFRWVTPLGLFRVVQRRAVGQEVAVVPDLGTVKATAVQFFEAGSPLAGLKTERYVGDGSEFESLRGYVPGLDARSIDWKSTTRHRKLICRQFRAERNHQLIVAIDTGHLMREPIEGVPRLDHAINRGLLLSYIGLKTGDRVGMYAFDAKPGLYLEPQGGVSAFDRLRQRSAELEYGTSETNYSLAVLELTSRLKRRSLVVVFTEFIDSVTAEIMVDNVQRLTKRHVVIFVALRDPDLDDVANRDLEDSMELSRAVVASSMHVDRQRLLRRLARAGAHVVDAPPGRASVDLINRYIEIKRREFI